MKMELLKSKFECDFMWRLQWFLLAQQNQRPANPHKNRRFENISMKTTALGWFFAPTAPQRKLYQADVSGVSQLPVSRYDIQLSKIRGSRVFQVISLKITTFAIPSASEPFGWAIWVPGFKLHPRRLTWNLRIHPMDKENHLPNHSGCTYWRR